MKLNDVRVEPSQAWALAQPRYDVRGGVTHRIRGGDYRPHIYWSRKQAAIARKAYPECLIVRVVINQVFA